MPNTRKTEVIKQEVNGTAGDVASVKKVDSVTNLLSPLPSIEKVASFGLTPNPSGNPPLNPAVNAMKKSGSGLATSASPSANAGGAGGKAADSGVTSSGATGSDANALGSGFRPIKRSRRSSENHDKDVNVRDFEGVDLAGISRRFPQEKRVQLAQRIDEHAEKVAGAWAALLLAQTGMRYAEWATTASRVEQTKQNTLRIVKAIVDYLTTASQAKLRQTISYIVAKRRRQGFGHEEVITSMLLLRRSFEKGCGPIDGEAGFLIDAVTRVMVGEVATYLHAINPHEESQLDVCVATEDDDELGVEHPEDLNLPRSDNCSRTSRTSGRPCTCSSFLRFPRSTFVPGRAARPSCSPRCGREPRTSPRVCGRGRGAPSRSWAPS